MHLRLKTNTRSAGFSSQQVLLMLLMAIPIGLIGIGVMITLAMHHNSNSNANSTAQEPNPAGPETVTPTPQQQTIQPLPQQPRAEPILPLKPLANPVGTPITRSSSSTCWFQMQSGGSLIGERCRITQRTNVNGDRVFDVVEPSGLKRSVVLWNNTDVEVFLDGQRYTGTWRIDDDGDVRIRLPGGTFAFRPPS